MNPATCASLRLRNISQDPWSRHENVQASVTGHGIAFILDLNESRSGQTYVNSLGLHLHKHTDTWLDQQKAMTGIISPHCNPIRHVASNIRLRTHSRLSTIRQSASVRQFLRLAKLVPVVLANPDQNRIDGSRVTRCSILNTLGQASQTGEHVPAPPDSVFTCWPIGWPGS
jgi:hypothetical protein